ncbi:DegT/DnrJ/EryC1/StrS family aminotransferase [Streptomyces sp. NPDC001508]|uniref:DegT/DnrJ/EryC1/StrS family aminotransferase n=1 Tax=Streptomyces sp. NPDC001508 TaxID=3154656 RepID=UPI003324E153
MKKRPTLALHGGERLRTKPFPQWPPVPTEGERAALLEVLDSGVWGSRDGTRGVEFARRFAERHGVRFGVTVANATLGLFAALRAAGVRRGDEVIIPPYTFVATATAVLLAGAVPVFADIDSDSMLISPESIARRVTPKTSAVMPVHLGGAVADVDAIRAVIPPHVKIIEDAAQALGAALRDRPAGSLGDLAVFSFQSSKNITAGEGGIIVTDDEELHEAAWSVANVGRRRGGGWYEHPRVGWNLRLTEFQSALLIGQLERLDESNARRTRATHHLAALFGEKVPGARILPDPDSTTSHGRYLAVIRFEPAVFGGVTTQSLSEMLRAEGIPASAGYPLLHRDRAIRDEALSISPDAAAQDCPVAEAVCPLTVWLPQNVLLADESDLADITDAFAKIQAALGHTEGDGQP